MESVSDSSGYLVVAPILVDDWAFRTLTHAGAAIDHKGGTCYVAGGVGGQEEDGVDYFFGLAGAGEWEGWDAGGQCFGHGWREWFWLGVDQAWA